MVWKKSSFTAQENCVELAHLGTVVAVRDSKDPDGPRLTVTHESVVRAAKLTSR